MIDLSTYEKLPKSFYQREDVVAIARELLGKYVFTNINGFLTGGKIVETEAYCGRNDRACHAFEKRTPRTEVMYQAGGIAYVYLCYGIHHLFNIVTNDEGLADAVLIRALEPVVGVDEMFKRRGPKVSAKKLTAGPGTLSQALAIHTGLSGTALDGDSLWVARAAEPERFSVVATTRVGVDYAGADALLPWRFLIADHPYVSVKPKKEQE
ncbi:DNA-3-methyladenine glycosylase [Marinoscillum furvescens]|uniref:Putative 3-methyladenine DNA glycosylase n=1 Tax=Marinoscillum furvescens DSM 4134 TaxID=1122208 RepID=A0A3D9L2L2_MARFU|nr:DNA-3-methyladenine glycosylase [Marinoscillum furvescens]RED97019.1 DNA-3-methyladenine glycosylase [Marinoscillum furvescens DSM 4134]